MYEAGVLQPWVCYVVVDATLRLGETCYLGVDQWTGIDCQRNCRHMDGLITVFGPLKENLAMMCTHNINKERLKFSLNLVLIRVYNSGNFCFWLMPPVYLLMPHHYLSFQQSSDSFHA